MGVERGGRRHRVVGKTGCMHVLFASAEFAPLARVGGLAAAAAGLVAELRTQGVDVDIAIPDYFALPLNDERVFDLNVPEWAGPASARQGIAAGLGEVILIDVPGIRRPHPYVAPDGTGYFDNDRRFFAFSAAIAALAAQLRPDVLHLNDWHTSAALGLLTEPVPSVLTIHTLGYQGHTNTGWLKVLTRSPEAFEYGGSCNPLVGGIRLADLVITVSPTYAREALDPATSAGIHEVLASRGDRFVGIRNGIDDGEWNPATDRQLPATFDVRDTDGKLASKRAVQAELGLDPTDDALVVVVSRLVDQKGIDLALPATSLLDALPGQFAVLGDGADYLVGALHTAAQANPGRVGFRQGYDEGLAHRLFAGGDLFLMPSRFEPCGLAQMQAMRYGTLPVVTDVGGLHDTVTDIDAFPKAGTGVVSRQVSAAGVVDGLHRGVRAWTNAARRKAMRTRGMTADWSWRVPAQQHLDWYVQIAGTAVR